MSIQSSTESSAQLEEILGFCAKNPVAGTDAARFITRLCSGPEGVVDLRPMGLVGVLVDRVCTADGPVPYATVGLSRSNIDDALADALLPRIAGQTRALGIAGVEISVGNEWGEGRKRLPAFGYRLTYTDLDMRCDDPMVWGADASLPTGWRWVALDEELIPEYARVLRVGFSGMEGTFIPPDSEILAHLKTPGMALRLLMADNGQAVALLRCRPAAQGYIHAIVRDPAYRGKGLGRFALDEARRLTGGKTLTLSVVDHNVPAVALYRGHGFDTVREVPAFRLDF